MRLTSILLLSAALHVSATGLSQKVTLSFDKVPVQKVFAEVFRQTGVSIIYTESMFDGLAPVSIRVKDASIQDVLNDCLKGQPFSFSMEGSMIVIKKKEPTTSGIEYFSFSPPIDIHGHITDDKGIPLVAASVTVKGSKKGSSTDANGNFELKEVNDHSIIIISFTGYESVQYKIIGNGEILVSLHKSNNPLDEVQVIAYGTTTKRLNTGDVSTVTDKTIAQQPVSNPLAAMEGRVPGMVITQNTGVPGGAFTVQIRGQNSIANGNDPYYIIDGVPYISQLLSNLNNSGLGGNPLNFLNPSDIESIDVLKDADATAIYGSRGANGVILITTKKGKAGNLNVNVNFYSGFGQITRKVDYLNTDQYLKMRHEAFANDGATPDPNYDYDLLVWDTTRYTDWQKLLIEGTSHYTDVQSTISGGGKNTQYSFGGGYHRETSVFPESNADQKASVHFNIISNSLNQKFRAQFSGNYVADNNNLNPTDFTSSLALLPPDAPPGYKPDGTVNWANSSWTNGENPFAKLLQGYKSKTGNLIGNTVLSYEVIPGLDLKANLGYNNLAISETITTPSTSIDPATGGQSQSEFNDIKNESWILEPQLTYRINIGKGVLQTLVGGTFQQNNSQGQALSAVGFSSDALLENIQAAQKVTAISYINSVYKYNSIFGRLNYNWEDKYLINITARRDGSSCFGPGNQFANFGAIGAAWIFSKEKFVNDNINFLSFGKLRGSYGSTGNDQIGDYKYMDLFTNTQFSYQNTIGLYPVNLFNPGLQWERNNKGEIGLDLGFIKDRILFSISYYLNKSSNQLVSYPLSTVTGFSSIQANLPAVVQNSGLEMTLNTTNIKTDQFSWTTSINLTIPRNKLLSYPNLSTSSYKNSFIIGQPISIRRVFHYAGVNDSTGLYQFADNKGVPTYNPSVDTDLTSIINTSPTYYGGFLNTFRYKGFELNIFFQFVKQNGISFLYNYLPGSNGTNQPISVLERWQKPGDITNIQRFNQDYSAFNSFYNAAYMSDQLYQDASFIRLKNLSIAYSIPESLRQKMRLVNLRIYVQCQNLLTITSYKGYDPENQSSVSLPPLKVVTAGIDITF